MSSFKEFRTFIEEDFIKFAKHFPNEAGTLLRELVEDKISEEEYEETIRGQSDSTNARSSSEVSASNSSE